MNVDYKRDAGRRYMIVNIPSGADLSIFTLRMLTENNIDGMLPCTLGGVDNEYSLYFDVDSKIPLTYYLTENRADSAFIRKLLRDIIKASENLRYYLLAGDCLLLEPSEIFVSRKERNFYFAAFPYKEESFGADMMKLSEYLITKMPHNDRCAVTLGYSLYKNCIRGDVALETLKSILAESDEDADGDMEQTENGMMSYEHQSCSVAPNERKNRHFRKQLSDSENRRVGKQLAEWFGGRFKSKHKRNKAEMETAKTVPEENVPDVISSVIIKAMNAPAEEEDECGKTIIIKKNENEPESDIMLIPKDIFAGENVYLSDNVYIVGREEKDADIVISLETVSRKHARLTRNGDTYDVMDLNSRNATKINGIRMKAGSVYTLQDGDEISFADAGYYYHIR